MSHSQRQMLIFSRSVKTLTLRQLIKLDDWLEKLDLGSIAIEGVRMLPFIDLYRNCRSLTLSHHLSSHSLSFLLCHSLSHMANLSLSLSLSHTANLSLSLCLSLAFPSHIFKKTWSCHGGLEFVDVRLKVHFLKKSLN